MIQTNVGWQCGICGFIGHTYDQTARHEIHSHTSKRFLEPSEIQQREARRRLERADAATKKQQADDLLAIVRDLSVTPPSYPQ